MGNGDVRIRTGDQTGMRAFVGLVTLAFVLAFLLAVASLAR